VKQRVKLLVYEHVSGGGFAGEAIPPSVLCEGFGMLRTLIEDFQAAGHAVTTMLDSRIAKLNPPVDADCVVPVFSSQEVLANLKKMAEHADAAYVIAPETDGTLRSLVEIVEQTGTASLNCSARSIEKVSDKAAFYACLRKLGLLLPKTLMFSVTDDLNKIKSSLRGSLDFPLIFKPSNGVSCGGLSVARNENQVTTAVGKIKRETASKRFLVQELINGTAASVSLLSTGNNVAPVSLNQQELTLKTPEALSMYSGGAVPFEHPLRAEAFALAEKIAKSFPSLRGYIGMDFVLTESEAVPIEVNPRLTTSYVGLRRTVSFNPAQAILNAVLNRELPTSIQSRGYACFSKVETPNPTMEGLQKTYGMNDVVSPPFPVSQNAAVSALISAYGATLREAATKFREAKKRVLNTIGRGK
jgi:predicted ATP-grasp superfamily ATP-dependent carboligase